MCSGTPQDYSGIGLCTPKMGMLCRINNVFHYNHSTRMVLTYLDGGIAYVTLRMILWFCQRHTPPFARNPHSSTRTMTTMSFGARTGVAIMVKKSSCWAAAPLEFESGACKRYLQEGRLVSVQIFVEGGKRSIIFVASLTRKMLSIVCCVIYHPNWRGEAAYPSLSPLTNPRS